MYWLFFSFFFLVFPLYSSLDLSVSSQCTWRMCFYDRNAVKIHNDHFDFDELVNLWNRQLGSHDSLVFVFKKMPNIDVTPQNWFVLIVLVCGILLVSGTVWYRPEKWAPEDSCLSGKQNFTAAKDTMGLIWTTVSSYAISALHFTTVLVLIFVR